MVRLKKVSYCYEGSEKPSLCACSLNVSKGEFVLLCGKSGCGKTTLTKLLNGIIPSQTEGMLSGHVYIDKQDITEQPIWKTSLSVGSVFQNPKTQFFNLDTTSELVFGIENMGLPQEQMASRLEHVLMEYRLESLVNKSVFELSGGEKQKIAIASAYMGNPDVYVLDEPSANLDQEEIHRLKTLLRQLKRAGKTVIIAEHRVWYLAELLDRAVYMENGKIVREWTNKQFSALGTKERANYGLRSIQPVTLLTAENGEPDNSGLRINNVQIKRNQKLLWKDLSFYAPKGKAIAIVGRNGAGKTTLAQVLCGLRSCKHGNIYLNGKPMTAKALRQNSFLIMQDVNHQLFAESVLSEAKLGNDVAGEAAMSVLAQMQLDSFAEMHPMALSGGQKQRLAVVDGCLCQKSILIFDEPTSGLDLDNMERVSHMIQGLAAQGKIVIVITHDIEFINHLGAEIIS
ncbi:ABC transporter ATP-binding protein [Aminipila butyrica]|uniref:ABC transporter ATP-binding protein n=1 Tax=Aminipila butyrica TaxID=433296 RepID=A0A858BZP0_9FIRM|nr:ABC transporter ATP-binding protein [Aminipila butyrica]QIB70410.1 ABC transporter ATP-binding protein [Aminipila butyrica]